MSITVDIDNSGVLNMLNNLSDNIVRSIRFDELATKGKELILVRTASGQDVTGQSFAEYSASYKAFKSKTRDVSKVNLMYDNDMLNSIQADSLTADSGVIFFADAVNAEKT